MEHAMVGEDEFEGIRRVLVVVAHPDDMESHCAGAVARLTRQGCYAALVVATSGEKGAAGPSADTIALAARREGEQLAAARLLGIQDVSFLRWPDGELDNSPALRRQIARAIRLHRPDLLITHDGEHPWPAYTAHRDHRTVGRVALEAAYPDARDWVYYPEQRGEGLTPHITPEAWLMMSQVPDVSVDITEAMDRKIQARMAHTSQHDDGAALAEALRARAAEIGRRAGVPYAESFKRIRFA